MKLRNHVPSVTALRVTNVFVFYKERGRLAYPPDVGLEVMVCFLKFLGT